MHKRPKGVRKRVPQSKGLRLRKTVRGKTISEKTIQVNINVLKQGSQPLEKILTGEATFVGVNDFGQNVYTLKDFSSPETKESKVL